MSIVKKCIHCSVEDSATSFEQQHCLYRYRWKGDNGPEQTDSIATGNLIKATPKSIKRFVYNTSAGVERYDKLPFSILNLFGKPFAWLLCIQ